MKKALITGITGQDGSYLTELLLSKGYEVHGIVRRSSSFNRSRIEHLRNDPQIYGSSLFLHYADLSDATSLRRIITKIEPTEMYHLAGQSHVGLSFEIPESTCHEIATATLGLLEIIRDLDSPPRVYLAATSEMFGEPTEVPQKETSAFHPTSPYGCAKAFATQLGRVYQKSFGLHICSGITYNHESERRGENFVTRKISLGAARIQAGLQETLDLGNMDAERDWGYAPEYVEAMWLMLQQDTVRDYVIATGELCSVRDFVAATFDELGIPLGFEGSGINEVGRHSETGKILVRVNPGFFRPSEPSRLVGDPALARKNLGWTAERSGSTVARGMVRAEFLAFNDSDCTKDRPDCAND